MAIVFIIGCARSGTSILGELVASHPDVTYFFEEHRLWQGNRPPDHDRWTEPIGRDVKRIRAYFNHKGRLVVEKCPRNTLRVPFLKTVFPEAKIIHIVRDGRDVACSLMPGIGGDEWLHLKPPGWRSLMENYIGLERCARAWQEIVTIALDDLGTFDHLQVRYEHLAGPSIVKRSTINDIRAYLALKRDPAMSKFAGKIQDRTAGSYHAKEQIAWYKDGHTRRIHRYRENMTPAEQEQITEILAPTLERLSYL